MRAFACALVLTIALVPHAAGAVGFQQISVPDDAGKPLPVSVWYPSDAAAAPRSLDAFEQTVAVDGTVSGQSHALVLISHGSGGSSASHYDTAMALADAGFVVAAVTHTGDNYRDQSDAGNRKDLIERPRQLAHVLDHMLARWSNRDRLDPSRVGLFGFSLGGFTVLVLSGGTPDLGRMRQLCNARPTAPECVFIAKRHGDQLDVTTSSASWPHDLRVKAVVAAAPAVSYLFGPDSLQHVSAPIQLWRASEDEQVPDEWNTAILRAELRSPPEEHVVAAAGHYAFLAPCSDSLARLAPEICSDGAGFDRAAFHRDFNADVVAFFRRTLAK
jgi:predicted dienelactone hydrolase